MDVDTSSYPRAAPPQQQNPLDQIGKLQEMGLRQQQSQKNAIGIDQEKLNLINQKYDYASKYVGGLLNKPDLNDADLVDAHQHLLNQRIMTPEDVAKENSSIPTMAELKRKNPNATPADYSNALRDWTAARLLKHGTIMESLNHAYGHSPSTLDTGQALVPQQEYRGALRPTTGQPIPKGLPVSTPGFDPNTNREGPIGSPSFPPGPAGRSSGYPGQNNAVPTSRPNPNLPIQPKSVATVPAPPLMTPGAREPGFEEGLKAHNADREKAKAISLQNIPALQAYKLIQGLRSGPTTGPWNEAIAALKANGILNIKGNEDPTAIYEEANKKLSQIVKSGGSRSDADLAKSEESSPSVKTQISPALIKLTRDLITQNRIEQSIPGAFKGKDEQNYLNHTSNYADKIDPRAFGYDLLPKEEKSKLWKEMIKQTDKNGVPTTLTAKRFFNGLRIAKEQGLHDQESLNK